MSEEAEIHALFESPMDVWEDAGISDVVAYLRQCPQLSLPAAWPAEW